MLVPIGKITEHNKISAAIIYDTERHEKRLVSIEELYSIAKDNNNVCGVYVYINNSGEIIAARDKHYIWKNIPECNGRCIPEDNKDKLILLGRYDSKQKKGYIVVDAFGHVKVFNRAEMLKEVHNENVVGAKIRKNGRLITYINYTFKDFELIKLGYKLDGDKWISLNNHEGKETEEIKS